MGNRKLVGVVGVTIFAVLASAIWFVWPNQQEEPAPELAFAITEPRSGQVADRSIYVKLRLDTASAISHVEMYIGDILRHISYNRPFDATIDTSDLADGNYVLTIKAYSPDDEITVEQSVLITINHATGASGTDPPTSIDTSPAGPTVTTKQSTSPSQSSSNPPSPSGSTDPGDTSAPTAPSDLLLAATDLTTASLSWNASTDNVGVTGYRVYRNGVLATTVAAPTTSFDDTGRNPGSAYNYAVRAIDAAGNASDASATVGITMAAATIWTETTPDGIVADDPGNNVNYGVKLRPKVDGTITGIRFYKLAGNTGEHLGALWTEGGMKLADVTFTNETATGWQTATFSRPVEVTADTVYVASYHTNEGTGAATPAYFATSGHGNDYIEALSGAEAGGNGVFAFNDFLIFPTNSFNNTNYWVDVTFEPAVVDSSIAFGSMPRIPWEGGPSYYDQFSPTNSSPFVNSNFFPIAVWAESVLAQGDVDTDKSFGLNTYVELTANTDLSIVRNNNMQSISGEIAGYGSEMVGWMVSDEVDMWAGPGDGAWTGNLPGAGDICNPVSPPGAPCGYTVMSTLLTAFPGDTRMRFANFGKGVLMWESDEQAERFVNDYTDALAADLYFYTDPFLCDPNGDAEDFLGIPSSKCRQASGYGVTMDRVRYLDGLDGQHQPIYAFIEDNHPFTEGFAPTITGDQLAGAVMNSIIHEARGIIYFNHSFGGSCGTVFHVLREACGDAVRPKVIETNQRLTALAEVLNTQSYEYTFNYKMDTMLKGRNGSYYIFAMTKQNTPPGNHSFTLPTELADVFSVEVMFEGRTIPVTGGAFTDDFAAESSYHIYRVTP